VQGRTLLYNPIHFLFRSKIKTLLLWNYFATKLDSFGQNKNVLRFKTKELHLIKSQTINIIYTRKSKEWIINEDEY